MTKPIREPALNHPAPDAETLEAVCREKTSEWLLWNLPFSSSALVGAARDDVPRTAIATAFVAGTLLMAKLKPSSSVRSENNRGPFF